MVKQADVTPLYINSLIFILTHPSPLLRPPISQVWEEGTATSLKHWKDGAKFSPHRYEDPKKSRFIDIFPEIA
jgi:hypothetical protein